MLHACADHKLTLIPTGETGIYVRGGRYVVVTRHRKRQVKTFHAKIAEAREAKSDRTGSARPAPQTKKPFEDYAREWVDHCQGRTARGFDADTRRSCRRALELYAIPHFERTPLRDIERRDVEKLITKMQRQGLSASSIGRYLATVRAMFADAVERGLQRYSTTPAPTSRGGSSVATSRAPLTCSGSARPSRFRCGFSLEALPPGTSRRPASGAARNRTELLGATGTPGDGLPQRLAFRASRSRLTALPLWTIGEGDASVVRDDCTLIGLAEGTAQASARSAAGEVALPVCK